MIASCQVPDFGQPVSRVSNLDGCKVYFADDSFVVCRFSGTEPLLRLYAEAPDRARAEGYIQCYRKHIAETLKRR